MKSSVGEVDVLMGRLHVEAGARGDGPVTTILACKESGAQRAVSQHADVFSGAELQESFLDMAINEVVDGLD